MTWLALRAFLGRIPRWAYAALAIGLAVLALTAWHKSEVRHADREGYARAMTEVQAKAERIRQQAEASARKAEQLQRDITIQERTANDEQARVTSARADDLRRMRPQAACRAGTGSAAAVSSPASGSATSSGSGDVAAVAVDWQWLIDQAEVADLNRAEVVSWRTWFQRQSQAYENWRKQWNESEKSAR